MSNRGRAMYTNTNTYPHTTVSTPGFIISGQRGGAPRHYVSQASHNVNDMKNNHIPNITHGGPIQMLPTHIPQRQTLPYHIRPNAPRNLPRGPFQYQLFLPNGMAYPGNGNHAYYQHTPAFGPQASHTAVMVPYLSNYPANQGLFYPSTSSRPVPQMPANLQQGPTGTKRS